MKSHRIWLGLLVLSVSALASAAEDQSTKTKHLLRYKFSKNESLRWNVIHQGTNETTIRGHTQETKSHSASTKLWRVTDANEKGHITIIHSVENVNMRQQLPDRPEVSYNSETDETAPPLYEHVAKTVGVPITTVTIDSTGNIIERISNARQANFGLGDIVMLLPPKAVKAGSRWYEPSELQVRMPDKKIKRIKIRKRYTLQKVLTGVATIRVKTEVLTPVREASVQAQLVQQLTAGTIKFDVDAGRVMSMQIDWDETVVGFDGPDSRMKYLARITEQLVKKDRVKPAGTTARAKRTNKPRPRVK